jgi:AAA+ superfamily predicted ATPase
LSHLPKSPSNEKLRGLLQAHLDKQQSNKGHHMIAALEAALKPIVGLEGLKLQLRRWAKGTLLNEKRRALGLHCPARRPPHMAFLGSPGTGKTMVARLLAELLHMVGVLKENKVVEVQRTDLVGEFVGHTGPRTRIKVRIKNLNTCFHFLQFWYTKLNISGTKCLRLSIGFFAFNISNLFPLVVHTRR